MPRIMTKKNSDLPECEQGIVMGDGPPPVPHPSAASHQEQAYTCGIRSCTVCYYKSGSPPLPNPTYTCDRQGREQITTRKMDSIMKK